MSDDRGPISDQPAPVGNLKPGSGTWQVVPLKQGYVTLKVKWGEGNSFSFDMRPDEAHEIAEALMSTADEAKTYTERT